MGVKVSKEINLISKIYNVFIEYNNEKLDKLDFSSIKLHNNVYYAYSCIPKDFLKSNLIRNFKIIINKEKPIYKTYNFKIILDKLSSSIYRNNKESLLENSFYNDGIEVIIRYNNNFELKDILLKFENLNF